MVKKIKKFLGILGVFLLIAAIIGASYTVYDSYFKEESVFVVSKLGSTGDEVKKFKRNLKNSDTTTATQTEYTAVRQKQPSQNFKKTAV